MIKLAKSDTVNPLTSRLVTALQTSRNLYICPLERLSNSRKVGLGRLPYCTTTAIFGICVSIYVYVHGADRWKLVSSSKVFYSTEFAKIGDGCWKESSDRCCNCRKFGSEFGILYTKSGQLKVGRSLMDECSKMHVRFMEEKFGTRNFGIVWR